MEIDGLKIRIMIAEQDKSVKAFCEEHALKTQTVINCTLRNSATTLTACRIAKALDVDIEEILKNEKRR